MLLFMDSSILDIHMLGDDHDDDVETPFRYTQAEIRTQVVVIHGPTRYQLDHGGALFTCWKSEELLSECFRLKIPKSHSG